MFQREFLALGWLRQGHLPGGALEGSHGGDGLARGVGEVVPFCWDFVVCLFWFFFFFLGGGVVVSSVLVGFCRGFLLEVVGCFCFGGLLLFHGFLLVFFCWAYMGTCMIFWGGK